MNKRRDVLRFVIISPEAASVLIVALAAIYWPQPFLHFVKLLQTDDSKIALSIIGIPFAMLYRAYKLCFDILNPSEHKKVLIKWPDYWHLKARIIFNLSVCLLNVVVSLAAWYLVRERQLIVGAALMIGGWATAAISIVNIAHAKITLHDILTEIEK